MGADRTVVEIGKRCFNIRVQEGDVNRVPRCRLSAWKWRRLRLRVDWLDIMVTFTCRCRWEHN